MSLRVIEVDGAGVAGGGTLSSTSTSVGAGDGDGLEIVMVSFLIRLGDGGWLRLLVSYTRFSIEIGIQNFKFFPPHFLTKLHYI